MMFGLRKIIFNAEYPHFDAYAQCDVEGRLRPVYPTGGIDRMSPVAWRTGEWRGIAKNLDQSTPKNDK